ncbi:nitrogenase component 1 [Desulfitobacterium dehalogenans]|uniref:nitrogenase component 1 n=1 Tax=Desulfitobacterium dehalogenans TaxID=36854 RepID=UPI001FA7EA9A|nr:nitrogenase component 1 [Desulfitobacterium dehalogenans]
MKRRRSSSRNSLPGSPVPAIIGRDMNGIAREIEARSGFAALGFATTGFSYYNKGISAAHLKLLKRFAVSGISTASKHVNILGLTPLDFSANDNGRDLIRLLEDNGFRINGSFWMQTELDQVRRAASAEVNLVVSQSGWAAARYLYTNYGIPYVAAAPLGMKHSRVVLEALRQTAADKQNRVIKGAVAEAGGDLPVADKAGALLIIGDQIVANSLRAALRQAGCGQSITVASFFGLEPELALPGDLLLKSEKQLIKLLRSGIYTRMIADPLILGLPAAAGLKGYSLPHPAISSLLHWQDMPLFIGEEFEKTILSWSD